MGGRTARILLDWTRPRGGGSEGYELLYEEVRLVLALIDDNSSLIKRADDALKIIKTICSCRAAQVTDSGPEEY